MRTLIFLIGLILLPLVANGESSEITIGGSVGKPFKTSNDSETVTLASALEQAGGIKPTGSDRINIRYRMNDQLHIMQLDGLKFYQGNIDYVLPAGATVFVSDCVGLGLGNLDEAEFAELNAQRLDYLQRKAEGKVRILHISPAN